MAVSKEDLIIQLKTHGVKLTKAQLKTLDAQVKTTTASMGAMGSMMKGMGFVALAMGMAKVVSVGKEFQQKMADVKAISGATAKEFKALEANARALGASTVFTASQVSELQKEFAKLGFSAEEIVNVTEGTLALASAIGADLADAAATAGTTLRGFGMDVSETGRVTDVMALSFSRSALDLQKFSDSMKYVAPIAKLAGVSLEGTTAILGSLANAGIDGSMAGTSLRRILLEAGKEGSKLAERMGGPIDSMEDFQEKLKKLRDDGFDPLTEGADLVGKRAVTAFAILLEGADKTNTLTRALNNAGGAAQKMADVQLDTLDGDLRKLGSATDELSIKMFNLAEEPLRNATQGMIEFVNSIDEGDIKAYITALELVIGSLGLYNAAILIAKLRTDGFALSLTRTGIGAIAVGLGILTAELMKYYKVFETENDKIQKATKSQEKYNDSINELADILQSSFTLDEARDEYSKFETVMGDVKSQIDMVNEDIAYQESLLGDVSDVLGGGGFIIYDEQQFNIIQKTISENKLLLAELEKNKDAAQEDLDIYGKIIERLENLITVKKKAAEPEDLDTGSSVETGETPVGKSLREKALDSITAVEEAEALQHQMRIERHGETMANAMEFVEQQAEYAQMTLDAMGGAVDAWQQKNDAEAEIYRKKLDKDEKAQLKALKNSVEYKRASDKEKKKLEDNLGDEQIKTREQVEKKIAQKEYETALATWGLSITQSLIDTSLAMVKALATMGPIAGPIMAGVVGGMGLIQTGLIVGNKPQKPAQFGMNEVIDSPTNLLVGEGSGPELVQVTPLTDENRFGPTGGANINISFEGNVLSDDFIIDEAIPKIREAVLRGESLS